MPNSALRRAATRAWCTPATVNVRRRPGCDPPRPGCGARAPEPRRWHASRRAAARPARPRGRRWHPTRCAELVDGRVRGRRRRRRWASPPPRAREARSTRPRRGRRGRPRLRRPGRGRRLEGSAWTDEDAGAEGRVELVSAEGDEVRSGREGPMRRRAGPHRAAPGRRARAPRAQISSTGGSQPVTLEAPVSASSAGRWSQPSSTSDHVVDVEGAVAPALDAAPACHPRPGEQVGVVLDHGGDHHVVGASRRR